SPAATHARSRPAATSTSAAFQKDVFGAPAVAATSASAIPVASPPGDARHVRDRHRPDNVATASPSVRATLSGPGSKAPGASAVIRSEPSTSRLARPFGGLFGTNRAG